MPPEAPKDDYRLNEPEPAIPGGPERESVTVDRAQLAGVAQRERINRLLLSHDPETAEDARAKLDESDLALLRVIAREGAVAGGPPALRRHAIAFLAHRPTTENLNVLEELARRGEDPYTRGAALVALGQTGLRIVAPILAEGFTARDPIEATAAERGVIALARAVGEPELRAAFHGERRKPVLEGVERALRAAAQEREPRRAKPKRQRAAADDAER